MRLSDGRSIDPAGIPPTFEPQLVIVTWYYDHEGAPEAEHTASFGWRWCGDYYETWLDSFTGEKPTGEVLAYLDDFALAAIPGHLEQVRRDR